MKFLKKWIPIPRLSPINTFHTRLVKKWTNILNVITTITLGKILFLTSFLGFNGARRVKFLENGNAVVRLNRDCALGKKGSTLQLPKDDVIYKSVQLDGSWELKECIFLANGITLSAEDKNSSLALIDIGANTGLVTLQVMNMLDVECDFVLFKPIPRHFHAIEYNLKHNSRVRIFNAGLASKNSVAEIYTQSNNHGNSSLLKSAMPMSRTSESISTFIDLLDTHEVCSDLISRYDSIVIKCDTQGMDALILSEFSSEFWTKVQYALIEVWALPEVDENHVSSLLLNIGKTHKAKWDSDFEEVDLLLVSEFWLSKSGESRNLFLEKRL